MGKYSLENYEQYQTLVFRPRALPAMPENRGNGRIVFASSDETMEDPARTIVCLSGMERIGDVCGNAPLGLLIPFDRMDLLDETAARGNCPAILQAQDLDIIHRADELNLQAAILLDVSEELRLDVSQHLADNGLGDRWQRQPVYARIQGELTEALKDDLLRWHVCAANVDLGLGCDLLLRRLTCPAQLSCGGALPLRLWFDNRGSAPLYGVTSLIIRLAASGKVFDISLNNAISSFQKCGDCVHNEILQLPMMPSGRYTLSIVLLTAFGEPFHLNIDADLLEGFYCLGHVDVDDQPRPELFTIWDHYYPEGYYPLEDPAQPLTDQ